MYIISLNYISVINHKSSILITVFNFSIFYLFTAGPSLVIHTHQHRTIPMTLATACPLGSTLVVSEPSSQQPVQHHETSSPCPVVEPPSLPPVSHYDEPVSHHNTIPQTQQQQPSIEGKFKTFCL